MCTLAKPKAVQPLYLTLTFCFSVAVLAMVPEVAAAVHLT
jgi:hypothetical protein